MTAFHSSSPLKLSLSVACLLVLPACDYGSDFGNVVPGEGPHAGNASTDVINEAVGYGGTEMMPGTGAPGYGGNATGNVEP